MNPKAMIMKTIILIGAIAGLAGMGPLLTEIHKYGDTFPTASASPASPWPCSGATTPAGIAVAAIVWAGIEQAAQRLPDVGDPPGDRPHPPGHPAAIGRDRLRGRPPLRPGRFGT